MVEIDHVYVRRFSDEEAALKDRIWREITRYLQRFVARDAAVLDIGCDRGDFIRNIEAREKWASDLRDVAGYLPEEISFVRADGLTLHQTMPNGHFDVVFMSNYLEHLSSNDAVIDQLRVAHTLLRPRGRIIVLQPNIRLVGGAYWDFIDHRVALTDRSLVEAAELAGFRPVKVVKRFLPYTTKTRLPKAPVLLRLYLAVRPSWLLVGKQSLFVGERV